MKPETRNEAAISALEQSQDIWAFNGKAVTVTARLEALPQHLETARGILDAMADHLYACAGAAEDVQDTIPLTTIDKIIITSQMDELTEQADRAEEFVAALDAAQTAIELAVRQLTALCNNGRVTA